jgi:hypothetical protein
MAEVKSKPKRAHAVLLGPIEAVVWQYTSARGDWWYAVTVSRRYRQANAWKHATTFGRDDLPLVVKAADAAYLWIVQRQLEDGGSTNELREGESVRHRPPGGGLFSPETRANHS